MKEAVVIATKDGSKFKLVPIREDRKTEKSPLEGIKGIETDVTMEDILEAIKDGRDRN